ncbi:hypothetical protein GGTG_02955 [Gaeumannomyces tritici R3-111a-1]|uniref:Uncharacterized protein n=1 Tax=Gaeumannomyces tritici (strain R3-111a-1) TaxID=644352 RepID=J3NNU9_GAET3|nr:hypothetical protein GGTG_02955 [Gaeumannomyces tritici R3-111a-1]EJT77852.1 hypothetical protein GGTG_02955 [Gaeumannomyces tritici R3-111a-1]
MAATERRALSSPLLADRDLVCNRNNLLRCFDPTGTASKDVASRSAATAFCSSYLSIPVVMVTAARPPWAIYGFGGPDRRHRHHSRDIHCYRRRHFDNIDDHYSGAGWRADEARCCCCCCCSASQLPGTAYPGGFPEPRVLVSQNHPVHHGGGRYVTVDQHSDRDRTHDSFDDYHDPGNLGTTTTTTSVSTTTGVSCAGFEATGTFILASSPTAGEGVIYAVSDCVLLPTRHGMVH